MGWLESLILGAVQGLTEFLPISSDGHLEVTTKAFDALLGRTSSGAEMVFFFVMLHVGTLVAILVYYRDEIRTSARGLLGSTAVPEAFRRRAVIRVGLLAVVATSLLVPDKLFFMDKIEQAFQSLAAAGVGFLVTAALLVLTLRLPGGQKGPAETTWLDALLVGFAQMFAPLPGVSRSGLTIVAALALGFSRVWAVGFSLLLAVAAILGAAVFEIREANMSALTADRVAQIVVAAVVAGLVGYAAIAWLVRIVRSGRLWYFSVYLVLLAAVVLALATWGSGSTQLRQAEARNSVVRTGLIESGSIVSIVRSDPP